MASNVLRQRLGREVHVWVADPREFSSAENERCFKTYLSEGEQRTLRSFRFQHDRRTYLVAHGLLREILSIYGHYPPRDWSFTFTSNGKPAIANEVDRNSLRFNLSHTDGAIAVIVARTRECGVDIERIRTNLHMDDLADSVFSLEELKYWKNLSISEQTIYFFETWTLKEAYLKGLGIGIEKGMNDISLERARVSEMSLIANRLTFDLPSNWHLNSFQLDSKHVLSTAVHAESSQAHQVVLVKLSQIFHRC